MRQKAEFSPAKITLHDTRPTFEGVKQSPVLYATESFITVFTRSRYWFPS
jgi:hypothetical protein